MEILITAGGTSERIDDVRHITNSGTGALGARVAEAFAAKVSDCRITYICSPGAARPEVMVDARVANDVGEVEAEARRACAETQVDVRVANDVSEVEAEARRACAGTTVDVRVANDVGEVEAEARRACAETQFDVIVHSMAIGDYRVRAVSDAGLMASGVIERLSVLACGDSSSPEEAVTDALLSPPEIREAKISSDKENLIVVLERAPKIISLYRGLAPGAVIVGFKLLSDVSEEELVRAGHALLLKNDCDFVLANDLRTVRSGNHEGLLIARDGTFERAAGKEGIAALVVQRALECVKSRG